MNYLKLEKMGRSIPHIENVLCSCSSS